MADLLARDEAPLTSEEWEAIDKVVVEAARRQLVARRFIEVYGPLGAGIQDLDYHTFGGADGAVVDVAGQAPGEPVQAVERLHKTVPLIYKDFVLYWRDIETRRRVGLPLDVGAAAAASAFVAQAEDDLIFNGRPGLGLDGLLTVGGRTTLHVRDWDEAGAAFEDVVAVTQRLIEAGFYGPYAVALSPRSYAQIHRVYDNTGVLEVEQIRRLATSGVFQSTAITDYGLVLSTGVENVDIAVAQDFVTAYLGPANLNHPFRVLESILLRIRRPGAICTFEVAGGRARRRRRK